MKDMQKQKNDATNSPLFFSKWGRRGMVVYIAVIALFYLLHINLLSYDPDMPEADKFLTDHSWTWYYPALGFGSVLFLFAVAKLLGFGLKRKITYWEEH